MFTFYWFFKRNDQFMFVFKTGERIEKATDKESLLKALESAGILVSYDNYTTFDREIALLLSDGKNKYLKKHLSIDLSQEIRNASIEEIGYYTKLLKISNTVYDYCMNRIEICEHILKEREEYFETKFEIVSEFNLNAQSIKKTRAGLAAEILGAVKQPKRADTLLYTFDERIPLNELPKDLIHFYERIKTKYKASFDDSLKNENIKMTLNNLTHTFGFGGSHGAKEKYKSKGFFLYIDAKAFYPTLALKNDWFSSGTKNKEIYREIYQKKKEYEEVDTKKSEIYKTIINASIGAMNNPYSALYDPNKFYNVTVNGQLIMTHLIVLLENFISEVVQTNTDGIVVKYNVEFYDLIVDVSNMWASHYGLDLSFKKITMVHQRNVNNYIFKTEDGKFIKTGIYKDSNYLNNSMPIIRNSLLENALNGTKVQDFMVQQFKEKGLEDFYFVGTKSKDAEKIVQKIGSGSNTQYKSLPNTVCGLATNKKEYGELFQIKKGLYSKLRNSPENFMNYLNVTKKEVNLNWYLEIVDKNIF